MKGKVVFGLKRLSSRRVTAIVADPDPAIRRLLSDLLCDDHDFDVIASVASAHEVVEAAGETAVSVVLLDASLADERVIDQLSRHEHRTRVVVLGAHPNRDALGSHRQICSYVPKESKSIVDEVRRAADLPPKAGPRLMGRAQGVTIRASLPVIAGLVMIFLGGALWFSIASAGFGASGRPTGPNQYALDHRALLDAAQEATETAARHATSRLTADAVLTPLTGDAFDEFDAYMRENVLEDSAVRVNIWSPDFRVIYSSSPEIQGRIFPLADVSRERALLGETRTKQVVTYGPEHAGLEDYGQLLEAMRPLVLGDAGIVGMIEVYSDYAQLTKEVFGQTNSPPGSAYALWMAIALLVLGTATIAATTVRPMLFAAVLTEKDGLRRLSGLPLPATRAAWAASASSDCHLDALVGCSPKWTRRKCQALLSVAPMIGNLLGSKISAAESGYGPASPRLGGCGCIP